MRSPSPVSGDHVGSQNSQLHPWDETKGDPVFLPPSGSEAAGGNLIGVITVEDSPAVSLNIYLPYDPAILVTDHCPKCGSVCPHKDSYTNALAILLLLF